MDRIVFRAPGSALPLEALLARAFGRADASLCNALVDSGGVSIGGRVLARVPERVEAGARVEIGADRLPPVVEPDLHSDAWQVLIPSVPWRRGGLGWKSRKGGKAAKAKTRGRGERAGGAPVTAPVTRFERIAARGPTVALALHGARASAEQVLAELARAGWPVLGDARRGGILIDGGPRIRVPTDVGADVAADVTADLGAQDADPHWWPREPLHFDPKAGAGWHVSAATARVVRRGHPWILPDAETEDPGRFAPGSRVAVLDPRGHRLGTAHIEGTGRVAARIWSRVGAAGDAAPVAERVAAAIARRAPLMARGTARVELDGRVYTDCLRLIHAEADGLPGLCVDRLGSMLRVLVSGAAALPLVDEAIDALRGAALPGVPKDAPILEVLHLRDTPDAELECVRLRGGDGAPTSDVAGAQRSVVHERGLAFRVEAGLAEPTRPRPGFGLYADQRENRARLARLARRGGRWLNLFAHTGAFSVALLAAGAEEVVSVDLSAAYLAWLEENLTLNAERGVDPGRHVAVRRDGRRYLDALPALDRFDGIVLDPPSAAAAGRRFWSAGRDLAPLIGEALVRLTAGGSLLVCRNTRGAKRPLEQDVSAAAADRGVSIGGVEHAGPGPDFPRLRGFREADAFQGLIVRRG